MSAIATAMDVYLSKGPAAMQGQGQVQRLQQPKCHGAVAAADAPPVSSLLFLPTNQPTSGSVAEPQNKWLQGQAGVPAVQAGWAGRS